MDNMIRIVDWKMLNNWLYVIIGLWINILVLDKFNKLYEIK